MEWKEQKSDSMEPPLREDAQQEPEPMRSEQRVWLPRQSCFSPYHVSRVWVTSPSQMMTSMCEFPLPDRQALHLTEHSLPATPPGIQARAGDESHEPQRFPAQTGDGR